MIPACRVMVSEPPGVQAPSGSLHLLLLLWRGQNLRSFPVPRPYPLPSGFQIQPLPSSRHPSGRSPSKKFESTYDCGWKSEHVKANAGGKDGKVSSFHSGFG